MMERIAETSPRFKARMAGVCQLMEAVTAAFGEVIIPGKLVVAGNAAATAANILGRGEASAIRSIISVCAHTLSLYSSEIKRVWRARVRAYTTAANTRSPDCFAGASTIRATPMMTSSAPPHRSPR